MTYINSKSLNTQKKMNPTSSSSKNSNNSSTTKEIEEQDTQKKLKRLQQEAFDALFTKLCAALRQENLDVTVDLYNMTLEQWQKEEDEKKRLQEQSTFSAVRFFNIIDGTYFNSFIYRMKRKSKHLWKWHHKKCHPFGKMQKHP